MTNLQAISDLEKICEEDPDSQDLSDLPELKSIKRLSCFEEICPSYEALESAEDEEFYSLRRLASEGVTTLQQLVNAPDGPISQGQEEIKIGEFLFSD